MLFAKLYESFSSGIDIEALKLGHDAVPKAIAADEQDWDFGAAAYDVVLWLAEEGFLRYENPNHTRDFFNARLTMKGLTVLGYLPVSLQSGDAKEPIIDKIKRILATGTEKAAADGIGAILGHIFNLASS